MLRKYILTPQKKEKKKKLYWFLFLRKKIGVLQKEEEKKGVGGLKTKIRGWEGGQIRELELII